MEKEQRTRLQKATQDARRLLEEEFRSQLLQTYDIDVEKVRWAEEPGAHLLAEQRLIREKLIGWIEHKEAQINDRKEALLLALREMAFTALNRFVALKLMEARELVRPCVSGGLESAGFLEFTAVAQGLLADQESSYRLFLETIFEDVSRELRTLFDPRDPASLLWPKRAALLELLDILNRPELDELWTEDETLGWVYQYFNGDAERKKMREESSAPRNSRELAVRNQFFTPRYVVEFLTDNTLGRIWYEMRKGDTGLKEHCRYLVRRPNEIWLQLGEEAPAEVVSDEALSQEELLRQPVHIPNRPLKDPREIRMLDPACGSMHFGLYAFDLYLAIYEEAWEIAQGSDEQAKHGEAFAPFVAYAADFSSKAAFLREVPRLILLHNIHGVDIDPRATQIARLTLWLRAQRTWQEQQLEVAARPPITRSNVVCAEPMPGERDLLADFVDQQFPEVERGLAQQLLEAIFDKMQLAGEAGSLLKIEEEIRDAIDQARGEWRKLAVYQRNLFSASELSMLGHVGSSLRTDLQSLTNDFWIDIEDRIYAALRHYAEQTRVGAYQRRLFAEDAAQGFAFIDVCRKRYDVAVMNPPFGLMQNSVFDYLQGQYPDTYTDIYSGCVARGLDLSNGGYLGAITSRSFLASKRLERWRVNQLVYCVELVADLGGDVMDNAMIKSAAFILRGKGGKSNYVEFLDARSSSNKSQSILAGFDISAGAGPKISMAREDIFQLPGARMIYSLPRSFVSTFTTSKRFEPDIGTVRKGLTTFDDFRFLRLRWEIPAECIASKGQWQWFGKGGEYANFYTDVHLLVNRAGDGAELAEVNRLVNGQVAQSRQASSYYYRPGCQYSGRSQKGFSARAIPSGCVMNSGSPMVLSESHISVPYLLGWLSSRLVKSLIEMQAIDMGFPPGVLKSLPWIEPSDNLCHKIETDAFACFEAYRDFCRLHECDPFFLSPMSPEACGQPLARIHEIQGSELAEIREVVISRQVNISSSVDSIYGCDSTEMGEEILERDATKEFTESELSILEVAARAVSYAMGVSLGRWDIRYATGEQVAPSLPAPLAPMPVCPPGQLQNDQGLPAYISDLPKAYPVHIAWDGVLVDDPSDPRDLENRVRDIIKIIWSGSSCIHRPEAIEQECCEILGVRLLRDYFRRPTGFFADHLKRYSKSRRQAPIYWQLSAGNGSYSAWLYYHRFTQDTIYRVLRDFVEPRIQQAEREQFELGSQGALSGDAAVRLEEAQTLLQDLRIFKSELDLVAPLWNPDLNDGVIINHAILWRITPYTPWQKKCKECWDKLVKGDYDWAHLAFHLWPERVIPKCITDRSLAIAHGLEERLWQETNNGNWLPRQLTEADLQALIAEHSNPAVKSALERFLAAPPPVAPTRTRASRSTRSAGSSAPRRPRGTAAVVDAEATRQVLLALTAAPSDGLAKAAIADLIGVEANAITAVIKQLKESGQIDQLGERRGARYVLSEQGRARLDQEEAT